MSLRMIPDNAFPVTSAFATAFFRALKKGNIDTDLKPKIAETMEEMNECERCLQPVHEGISYDQCAARKRLNALMRKTNRLLDDCSEKPLVQSL